MKKIILILIMAVFYSSAIAQNDSTQIAVNQNFDESITLLQDKTLYAAGESVLLTALVTTNSVEFKNNLSKILYIELISPDGKRFASGKYPIVNGICSTSFPVPVDLLSGNYYIRAYTRSLRAKGADFFAYQAIKVINLAYSESLACGRGDENYLKNIAIQEDSIPLLSKSSFFVRDSLKMNLESLLKRVPQARAFAVSVTSMPSFHIATVNKTEAKSSKTTFWPETRGVTLTGRIVDKKMKQAVPNAVVSLSLIGYNDIMTSQTDSTGSFFFALPNVHTTYEVFVSTPQHADADLQVLIDNDYFTESQNLPNPPFQLSDFEKKMAVNFVQSTQILRNFVADTLKPENEIAPKGNFYGRPTNILKLDDYVQLANLEEYFNELPLLVKVRTRKGKKYFKVISQEGDVAVYDPLVLLDNVALDDINKILAISPSVIDRIEIINQAYVKGNIIYGGIISLISKKSDYSGVELPKSGIFVDYGFVDTPFEVRMANNSPDARTSLYWDGFRAVGAAKTVKAVASDVPGTYFVRVFVVDSQNVLREFCQKIEILRH